MDQDYFQNYSQTLIHGTFWSILAVLLSCGLSFMVVCTFCRILRFIHHRNDERFGITLETIERTGSHECSQSNEFGDM